MRLFSEEVTPTFTNSNLNIITVKDFNEVFFDVYELEINGKKYVAEKVAEYKGSPVISASIIIDDKEYTGNFVLNRGKFEILVNKESLTYQQNVDDNFIGLLSENYKADEVDELIFEKRDTIIEDIQNAKLSAKKYIDKLKQKQIQEATKIHQEKLNEFNAELKEIQQDLVEEFVRVVSNVRSDISLANDSTSKKLKKFITGKVTILAESLENNLENKVEELETYINERVNSIASDIVSGVIATEIKSSNNRLDENIDGLFNHINLKLTELVKEHEVLTSEKVNSILSSVDDKLVAIDQVSIELNNSIQKSSNKALSRIGNVKIQLEENIAKNVTALQHDIDKASERIKVYYDEELNKLNEAVNTLSDETKQECVKLISESRDSLLQVISEIKTDVPNIIIEKKDGTGKEIDLKKVKSELEKSITTRFSTELMSLKRMMEMMSGGGSVAKQFADGGTMNGNLTVVGTISASQYLGIPGGGGVSGDYLPLSGGTVNGFLTVTDSVNFDGGVDFNTFVSNDITLRGNNNVTLRATDLLGLSSANTININAPNITLSSSSGVTLNGDLYLQEDPENPGTRLLNVEGIIQGNEIYSPSSIYTDTVSIGDYNLYFADPIAGAIVWGAQSRITNSSNGVIRLTNNTASNFSRLQFGGVTAGFPAIKRNGSGIDIVNAADTGFTDLRARNITATGILSANSCVLSDGLSATKYSLLSTSGEFVASKNVRGWVFGTKTFSVVGQETNTQAVEFKPDGTLMYITGTAPVVGNDKVFQYSLSSAWDLNTASYTGKNLDVGNIDPVGISFRPNGLEIFVINNNVTASLDRIRRFSLSAAWDISSADTTPIENFQINTIPGLSGTPSGICFKPDGTKMYIADTTANNSAVYELNLSEAWTLSSASLVLPRLDVQVGQAVPEGTITDVTITNDGSRVLIIGSGTDRIIEYKLPIPWSLSGCYFDGRTWTTIPAEGTPNGLYYNDIVNKCFFTGSTDVVREAIADPQPAIIGTRPMILSNPSDVNDRVVINSLQVTDTTGSSNSTTGALVVAGGVGVGGAIYAGGAVNATGTSSFGNIIASNNITTSVDYGWSTGGTPRSRISSPSDGIILLRTSLATGNDFYRLQFGDITSSFPAIKRNGSGLDIRDAADTGFTDLRARNITATGTLAGLNLVTGGAPLSATSSITLALTDLGRVIRYSGVAAISATVPDQSTVAWPDGSVIYLRRNTGAGTITIQGSGGTIINDNISTSIPAGSMMAIRKVVDNEWDFI